MAPSVGDVAERTWFMPLSSREEWPAGLDVGAFLGHGFVPKPFGQFVLKLAARCDLACDYCYVFEMADQTWRTRPTRMGIPVLEATAIRIREHAERHGLTIVQAILHGGEPLLAGADGINAVARILRRELPEHIHLDLRIQTNGMLLDRRMLDVLARHRIRVGISLDGDRVGHDRHRRRPDGRGSYDSVDAAASLISEHYPEIFGGFLCTVDLANDPVTTYEALLNYQPPAVDLLLPLGNWSHPPPGLNPGEDSAPYGNWLAAVFDRWYPAAMTETWIRLLGSLMRLLLGGDSEVETVGLSPDVVVVVDTDGSLEQVDTLRSAFQGATDTGLSVMRDSFDAALRHPGMFARQLGLAGLSDTCRACSLRHVCGGGYYPHRYRAGSGFLNPSVYCRDLQHLIIHVHQRMAADLAAATWHRARQVS